MYKNVQGSVNREIGASSFYIISRNSPRNIDLFCRFKVTPV